jgi:hypothetical protein
VAAETVTETARLCADRQVQKSVRNQQLHQNTAQTSKAKGRAVLSNVELDSPAAALWNGLRSRPLRKSGHQHQLCRVANMTRKLLVAAAAMCFVAAAPQRMVYVGSPQLYVVPPGVTSINVTVSGSGGSSVAGRGGRGATVTARLQVRPGETLMMVCRICKVTQVMSSCDFCVRNLQHHSPESLAGSKQQRRALRMLRKCAPKLEEFACVPTPHALRR